MRGTLNSAVDEKFPSKKAEKAALVNAHNAEVLARGRSEISTMSQRNHHSSQVSSGSVPYSTDQHRTSIPPDPNSSLRGSAVPGSHSAVFGLTQDGTKHLDTSPSHTPPQQSVQDLSSVSSASNNAYVPPRGTAVRQDSGLAPESLTGNVERVPTAPHNAPPPPPPGTNQAAVLSGEDFNNPVSPVADKKQGTFSKLFKRKPVAGDSGVVDSERKKYY